MAALADEEPVPTRSPRGEREQARAHAAVPRADPPAVGARVGRDADADPTVRPGMDHVPGELDVADPDLEDRRPRRWISGLVDGSELQPVDPGLRRHAVSPSPDQVPLPERFQLHDLAAVRVQDGASRLARAEEDSQVVAPRIAV